MKPQALSDLSAWRRVYAPDVVGVSPSLEFTLQIIQRCADTDSTVLITGESGTGKELLAEALHRASPRNPGPFVAVNCAALPESLVEAELFGHAKGAFTGASGQRLGRLAAAQGGTLFLDEVGDLPLFAQAKLLRALQERRITPVGSDASQPFDVRIVAATHRNLEEMVDRGEFRLDLYYRLSVIRAQSAPLRDRPEDILPLVHHFVEHFNAIAGRNISGISTQAEARLLAHRWPGNVRELSNTIERAVVLGASGVIDASALGLEPPQQSTSEAVLPEELDLRKAIKLVEQQLIKRALDQAQGNRTEAAALLGLNRTTLVEKLRKLG